MYQRIAVIGSGISSLSFMKRLLKICSESSTNKQQHIGEFMINNNTTPSSLILDTPLQITCFEKAKGIGGRMATRRVQNNLKSNIESTNTTLNEGLIEEKEETHFLDHGAQYFTCQNPTFQNEVNQWIKNGIVKEWKDEVIALYENGEIKVKSKYGSLQQVELDNNFPERFISVKNGMNFICKQVKQEIEKINSQFCNVKFEMEKRVKSLQKEKNGQWRIQFDNLEYYNDPFDFVIFSCPPEQTVEILQNSSNNLLETFNLKSKIKEIKMAPCWALLLVFNKPLKQSTIKAAAFTNNSKIISWIANQNAKATSVQNVTKLTENNGDNISGNKKTQQLVGQSWVIHASAEWSTENLEKSPKEIQEILYNEFLTILSTIEKKSKEELLGNENYCSYIQAHRWRYAIPKQNNFSKDNDIINKKDIKKETITSSVNENNNSSNNMELFINFEEGIGCIGDWTQQGRVEGAFMSGYYLANKLSSL
ncbi:hypothetical protein ABK040_009621 [Willaertia magna]